MTRLTDNTRVINVTMSHWTDTGWGPDETADILGPLRYNEELDALEAGEPLADIAEWLDLWEQGRDEGTADALRDADDETAARILAEISARAVIIEGVTK